MTLLAHLPAVSPERAVKTTLRRHSTAGCARLLSPRECGARILNKMKTKSDPAVGFSILLDDWNRRESELLNVLMDGHPNPEGYMEWWYAQNPKPI